MQSVKHKKEELIPHVAICEGDLIKLEKKIVKINIYRDYVKSAEGPEKKYTPKDTITTIDSPMFELIDLLLMKKSLLEQARNRKTWIKTGKFKQRIETLLPSDTFASLFKAFVEKYTECIEELTPFLNRVMQSLGKYKLHELHPDDASFSYDESFKLTFFAAVKDVRALNTHIESTKGKLRFFEQKPTEQWADEMVEMVEKRGELVKMIKESYNETTKITVT